MEKIEVLKQAVTNIGVDSSKITEDMELKELGLDSLDTVQVMMEIEEKLNIEFATEELVEVKTVKDILSLIDKKIS